MNCPYGGLSATQDSRATDEGSGHLSQSTTHGAHAAQALLGTTRVASLEVSACRFQLCGCSLPRELIQSHALNPVQGNAQLSGHYLPINVGDVDRFGVVLGPVVVLALLVKGRHEGMMPQMIAR
ncbi:hypothetical protein ACFQ0G_40400 [Streptomyces chiangmaiensis]